MTRPDDVAHGGSPRRRPRWVRMLLAAVAVLAVLLVADRVADAAAARATATRLRESLHLAQQPHVDVLGFPFLTQAVRGRFEEIDVDAADVPTPVLPLADAHVRLYGVRAGLLDALDGDLPTVPIARADATVLLRYRDLAPLLAARLAAAGGILSSLRDPVLAPRDGRIAVTAQAEVLGRTVPVEVDCAIPVEAGRVSVVPQRVSLPLVGDRALPDALSRQLAVPIPTRDLPLGVTVRDVAVTETGLQVAGDSTGLVVDTR